MQTVRMLTGAVAIALAPASLPAFSDAGRLIVHDSITRTEYDGTNDDLLSAGLNHDGLKSTAAAPGFADAVNPTPAELRRRAIYNNYRAIVDVAEAGGFGVLWGPKLAPTFAGIQQGLIPGLEYKGYLRVPDGDAGHVNNVPPRCRSRGISAPKSPASWPRCPRDRAASTAPSPSPSGRCSRDARWRFREGHGHRFSPARAGGGELRRGQSRWRLRPRRPHRGERPVRGETLPGFGCVRCVGKREIPRRYQARTLADQSRVSGPVRPRRHRVRLRA